MRRKAMEEFPRGQMDAKQTKAKIGEKPVPQSTVDFIEVNGEKLYPSINTEEGARILVFSATKPTEKVTLPHFKLHINKMHWWYAGDKLFFSEERPSKSVIVDELRKNVAKAVVRFSNTILVSRALRMTDTIVPLVLEKLGSNLEGLNPEVIQTIIQDLVINYVSNPKEDFSDQAVKAAKQVMRFDSVWKAIKSSCVIYPSDFVELLERHNNLKAKDGGAVDNKDIEEFLKSFKAMLGGASISRKVLFSTDFTEAMKLHINDLENSKMLMDALKSNKANDPAKVCQAYVSCMKAIEGSRQFFPNNSEEEKKATALRIEKFISQVSAKIQHNEINSQLLHGIGAMIHPDTAFIVSPKKTNVIKFAKEFRDNFPALDLVFRGIIERENESSFEKLSKGDRDILVDKYLQKMVGDLENKLEKYAKDHHQSYNAYREFKVQDGAHMGQQLLALHGIAVPHHKGGQKVTPHKPAHTRSISNVWGMLGTKSAWGRMDDEKLTEDRLATKVAASVAKAVSAPKSTAAKDFVEINGEKLYPQLQENMLVFSSTKPRDLEKSVDLSMIKLHLNPNKMHWYCVGDNIFFSEGRPIDGVIVDQLRRNIAKQVISSFRSTPNVNEVGMINHLIPMVLKVDPEAEKLSPELLESITKNLVRDWNSRERQNFSNEAIEAAKQVMRFDGIWKAIKSSCEIHPNDYVELNKRYNRLVGEQAQKGGTVKNKVVEEFLQSFKALSGGGSISRKVLFSNDFTEALRLYVNDPVNSKKLLDGLQRGNSYNPTELCNIYVSNMRIIEEYRGYMPDSAEKTRDAKISDFIVHAANQFRNDVTVTLSALRDQIIPDSAFLTSPKIKPTEFAVKFKEQFPNLYTILSGVIKEQNPKDFAKVSGNEVKTKALVDKNLKNMVGKITVKLQQSSVPKSKVAFNAYREFKVLESTSHSDMHTAPKAQAQAQEQEVPAVVIHAQAPEGVQAEKPKAQPKELESQTHMVKNLLVGMKLIKDIKEPTRREDLDVGAKGEPEKKAGLLRRAAKHLKGSGKPHIAGERKPATTAKFVAPADAGKDDGGVGR